MSKQLDLGSYRRLKQAKTENVFQEMHPHVQYLLSLFPLMWEERGNMLTGSDFADALNRGYWRNKSPPNTRASLLHRKVTGEQKKVWGTNTDYGNKFEPLNLAAFETWLIANGHGNLHHLGTMSHAMVHGKEEGTHNDRLGGTIDACTSKNWLVEAKCLPPDPKSTEKEADKRVKRKEYHDQVVPYYMDQIQGYLWVYGFDGAFFTQYMASSYDHNEKYPHILSIVIVKKDENWAATNRPLLEAFIDEWDKKKEEREDKILNFFK